MQGKILDYSVQTNAGLISGNDGQRYTFTGEQWKVDAVPVRGKNVDFDTKDNEAIEIYSALGASGSSSVGEVTKPAITLWAIMLGGFGAHKFYMGAWGWGIVYLLFCWLYIPFIVAMVEWIRYVLMTDEEFYAKMQEYKSQDQGPFGWFW